MGHRLFTLASALSLALCLAAALLSTYCWVADANGFVVTVWPPGRSNGSDSPYMYTLVFDGEHTRFGRSRRGVEAWDERFRLPHWVTAALGGVLPLTYSAGVLRRLGLRRSGLCIRCGYDLRATPDRCPECGAVTLHRPRISN